MRILIITYSREVNPGTFLQAYGVQFALKQLFPNAEIELLRHKRLYNLSGGKKGGNGTNQKKSIKWLWGRISAVPRRLKYEYYYKKKFRFTKQEFDLFDYDEQEFKSFAESYDLIVVGSDTILIDLKKNDKYGLMWLLNINTNKILFAASASPAKYEITESEKKMLHDSFSTFKALGVRDSVTYSLLSQKLELGDKVYRQFDPTYLIPESHLSFPLCQRLQLTTIRKRKKIALVNFGDGFEGKKAVTEHLKKNGYYTISTLRNEWADKNLMTLSPFEWAAMFQYIDMAVTERFHDSVFALRNNKSVVAVDWSPSRFAIDGSSKTKCLLECYGISDMHFTYHSVLQPLLDHIDRHKSIDISVKTQEKNNGISLEYKNLMKGIKSATVFSNLTH